MSHQNIEVESLDEFDLKIIRELGRNARISVKDLASRIGLSKTPCHNRIRRLENEGYIIGYRALVDPVKLKLDHIAFVEVRLSTTRAAELEEFGAAVCKHPEVEQCHMIASNFDYLIKVRTRDIRHYRTFLGETLAMLPYVKSTSTHVSMEALKEDTIIN